MPPDISYLSTMNYVTSDLIFCVLIRVEMWERGVEMIRVSEYQGIRVSGSEMVTHLVNKANLVHNISWYVYTYSFPLHVSSDYVSIIKRNNCIFATLGICHFAWMTVWYAECTPCIPDSYPHRITSTKCLIDTVISPDDGHIVARNM